MLAAQDATEICVWLLCQQHLPGPSCKPQVQTLFLAAGDRPELKDRWVPPTEEIFASMVPSELGPSRYLLTLRPGEETLPECCASVFRLRTALALALLLLQ